MNELHTYVDHIWNEWVRGFDPKALTPWYVRPKWLEEDEAIFTEFIVRIGCRNCSHFSGKKCTLTVSQDFEKADVPCKNPDI